MKNPWLKKNPLMSMWLSGANAMLGVARSQATPYEHVVFEKDDKTTR